MKTVCITSFVFFTCVVRLWFSHKYVCIIITKWTNASFYHFITKNWSTTPVLAQTSLSLIVQTLVTLKLISFNSELRSRLIQYPTTHKHQVDVLDGNLSMVLPLTLPLHSTYGLPWPLGNSQVKPSSIFLFKLTFYNNYAEMSFDFYITGNIKMRYQHNCKRYFKVFDQFWTLYQLVNSAPLRNFY